VQIDQYGVAEKKSLISRFMNPLIIKAQQHFKAGLPFAVYNKPNADQLIGLFQCDNRLHYVADFKESGFVLIESFQPEATVYNHQTPLDSQSGISKEDYKALVNRAIQAIDAGDFDKVVLSRTEIVKLQQFDLRIVLKKLVESYPSAFTYCFFHPKVGLWLGGFSEQLLWMNPGGFQTMAVAGTQPFHENQIIWGDKEKAEQQFVTDFIVDSLQGQCTQLEISEPYTMRAGNLVHIKTDIQGKLKPGAGLKEMLEILHPTPAVCGFPKESARQFLLKNEGYDREFYSGFLGEFNIDFTTNATTTDLYVNLRCLQSKQNAAILYVGGGITKDSDPESEWQETVNKSLTMKRILT
jgi:isochorismate synthase